jgi:hypothetical protein
MRGKRPKPGEPVSVEELKDEILRMIVERFDGRPLSWDVCEHALSIAAFEIKQAAMFAPAALREQERKGGGKRRV